MRILYITPFLQHPAMQASCRHYLLVRELARRHRITLLTPTKKPVPPEVIEELRSQVEQLLVIEAIPPPSVRRNPLLRVPLEVARKIGGIVRQRALIRRMRRKFQELARSEPFDLVVFHGDYSLFGVVKGWKDGPMVFDLCDATSVLLRGRIRHTPRHLRPLHWLRYMNARRVEGRMVSANPYVCFISERDRDALTGPGAKAAVIPNAVDVEHWTRSSEPTDLRTLVFHGVMDYHPNVDAAQQLIHNLLPRMHEVRPDLRLIVVGRNPLPDLVESAEASPNVAVTGQVEDVRPFLERASVHVSPLRFGAGQQNKLLEAMAMEVPVVTSTIGAEGLRVGEKVPPVVVEDDPDRFASAVLRLLDSEEDRSALRSVGRRFISENFGIQRTAKTFEEFCLSAVQGEP